METNTATIIAQEVERVTGVPIVDMKSERKDARTVVARHMCWVLMRELTTFSTPKIARALGRNDHTTVLSAINSWPYKVKRWPEAERIGEARAAIVERTRGRDERRRAHAQATGVVAG